MSTKKPRVWAPKGHRAVDWNEKAVQKVIDECGYVYGCVKYDGFRCHLFKGQDGEWHITTREGIEIESLRPFHGDLPFAVPTGMVLDAEVYIVGMPFEDMSGHLRRNEPLAKELLPMVKFVIFDCVDYETMLGKGEESGHYIGRHYRRRHINNLSASGMYNEYPKVLRSMEEVKRYYTEVRESGFEGLVLKHPELHYRNGKVSGWWKVKPGCGAAWAPGFEADGVVRGVVIGADGKGNEGLIVGFTVELEDGARVNATGLTKAAIVEYSRKRDWDDYLGLHCRVSGMERTKDGSIRHPHFDGFRDIGGTKA